MAFSSSVENERFSLLLLDPAEIYFEDYAVNYHIDFSNGSSPDRLKNVLKGRLKICSKSILFDPKDVTYPILKFPLKECKNISEWTGDLMSSFTGNKDGLVIESNLVVKMLEGNVIAPYKFDKNKQRYLFTLHFVSVDDCLPNIAQLKRASTLPAAEQASMIAAIVLSRQSRVNFNTSWLENLYEDILLEKCGNKIAPLVTNPGRILLTSSRLYFQPYNNVEPFPVMKLKLSMIKSITCRRFLLRHVGLEIMYIESAQQKHLYLTFKTVSDRNEFYSTLSSQADIKLDEIAQKNMTLLWQNGILSNYDYLLFLNSEADRSFNDLTQYPVFPFVIQDYLSSELDLNNPSTFRDLSKPIGALNAERLARLKERFEEMTENAFLYGSHYSTPGFVLYYLVRQCPQFMLCLQNGKFDHPDRMFNSIIDTWKNVTTGSADFKEMIPEFYDLDSKGSFLLNGKNIDFGIRFDGQRVDNVELPPWAEDPADLVKKLREALECDYVSKNLHNWIDLVFGYKQKGKEAIKADNVFYYLTYEGAIDLESIYDLNERHSMEVQIMEFGQIPKQIFNKPHPIKSNLFANLSIDQPLANIDNDCNAPCNSSDDNIESSTEEFNEKQNEFWNSISDLYSIHEFSMHKGPVSDICISSNNDSIFSVSKDTLLKMYSLESKAQLRSISVTQMPLSSCVLMMDQKTVIVGSWDNNVYMYNVEYGKLIGSRIAHDDAVCSMSWKNNLLATSSWDSTAKVWKYKNKNENRWATSVDLLAELDHDSHVTCNAIDSNLSLLITGTSSGKITLWSLGSFNCLEQYYMHTDVVHSICISKDDQKIASCGQDCFLNVLDVSTGMQVFNKKLKDEPKCITWDGRTLLSGDVCGNVSIWNMVQLSLVKKIKAHNGGVTCITVSSNGNMVATGGEDGKVSVWKSL